MEGNQVTTSSLVSEGEAMLVAEIIKLGLRQGLEDLPSSKGPCCRGSRSRFLGSIFPHLFLYLLVHLLFWVTDKLGRTHGDVGCSSIISLCFDRPIVNKAAGTIVFCVLLESITVKSV